MRITAKNLIPRVFVLLLAFMLAQDGALAQDRPAASQQQLDQMLAPIALYPDALLSQILMASTYPLEVVEAARWSRSHPNLAGDDAVWAAENEDWDPSVKSLVAFPQVLARMDENLQWTQSLGDAFLDQQQQVMDTVQNLRHRAQEAGNLRSDDSVRVVDSGPDVMVEYVNPQIIYVPYYDPTVVYGTWWWPVQPVYWQPWPGYYWLPGFVFYRGAPIGISAGFFFGGCDWSHRQVRIVQANNYYYNSVTVNRRWNGPNREIVAGNVSRDPGVWQHDPAHRRGVVYRNMHLQQRFGGAAVQPDVPRRDPGRSGPVTTPERGDRAGGFAPGRPGMDHDAEPRTNEHRDRRNNPRDVSGNATQLAPQPHPNTAVPIEYRNRPDRGNWSGSPQQMQGAESIPQRHESRPAFHGRQLEQRHEPAAHGEAPRMIEDGTRMSHPQAGAGVETGKRPEAPRVVAPQGQMPQVQMSHPQPEAALPAAPHAEKHREQPNAKEQPAANK